VTRIDTTIKKTREIIIILMMNQEKN